VKDGIHACDRALREWQVGEIALEKLDTVDVIQIAPRAGDQTVGDTNAVAAANEFFRQVGTDDPCATRCRAS
jgi:hypothetical protein